MKRRDRLYAQNWVEQFRANVEERGRLYGAELDLHIRRHYVSCFYWENTREGDSVWRRRQIEVDRSYAI